MNGLPAAKQSIAIIIMIIQDKEIKEQDAWLLSQKVYKLNTSTKDKG